MPRAQQPPSCRFYLTPVGCREGKHCPFLHQGNPPDLEVCKFFLQGSCSRGNYCRFLHKTTGESAMQAPSVAPSVATSAPMATTSSSSTQQPRNDAVDASAADPDFRLPDDIAWMGDERDDAWDEELEEGHLTLKEGRFVDDDELGLASMNLSGTSRGPAAGGGGGAQPQKRDEGGSIASLCHQFMAHGSCPRGDECKEYHGLICSTCGKWAIHPADEHEAAAHVDECKRRHDRLQARLRSTQVECGICMEKVLAKINPADRRFGLLQCDHAFCIRCIREWRAVGEAGISAVRACPLCRTFSGFVIPSTVWPETMEEKQNILSMYQASLSEIRCRHFDEGACPFGTSCFYRHILPDGTEASKDPNLLRRYVGEEGEVKIQQQVTLSDFIFSAPAGRRLGRR